MPRTASAAALLCALALSACASIPPPVATLPPAAPRTAADAAVARAADQLDRYCGALQTAVWIADHLVSDQVQRALNQAGAVLDTVCAAPPRDVASAAATAGRAYTAIQVARQAP